LSFRPPRGQRLEIAGPAGALEVLLEDPQAESAPSEPRRGFGVVCHPHPLHGGTMLNKVVHMLARALQEQGLPTLRFNYRGVGRSEGQYDEGAGETADALAVIAWGRARWPQAPLSLAGFSFGSMVVLMAAPSAQPVRLITVAPAVSNALYAAIAPPSCPWLIVQGEADELIDYHAVVDFAARFAPPPVLRLLPGADHFFNGHLLELREAVLQS
jgi:alpha/beta superfamily hydrolase